MNWPPITVLIVTFDRPKEVRKVIGALQDKLTYPGELLWHLADDSTPTPNYAPDILRDFPDLTITHTTTPGRSGFGVNANTGLRAVTTPYVFFCEDDQVAIRALELELGVFIMEHVPVGLIRYDGVEGHRMALDLMETPRVEGRRVHYMQINKKRSKGLYSYSNRPHLKHSRFHSAYGDYPEGLNLGSTEQIFAWKVRQTAGPAIAVLSDGIDRAFRHIGKSRQHSSEDIGMQMEPR